MSIGQELKNRRLARKLTQTELSAMSGIKQPTISAIENGVNQPTLETLTILSRALNCSVHEIMGESWQMLEQKTGFNQLTPEARELLDIFDQLNDDGRRTLITIAAGLLDNPALREEKESKMAK